MVMTRGQAARWLGAKTREIIDIVETADGQTVVTTHDHTSWTLDPDGVITRVDLAAAAAPAGAGDASEVETEPADPDAVPDGPAADVLGWVGEDTERAGRALAAERERAKPRTSLVAPLEKLLAPPADPE